MKFPGNISKVKVNNPSKYWIFPPIGFIEIDDANDGAGNHYGLYWELGKEHEEPIVFFKDYEELLLFPSFLNLDSFLEWRDGADSEQPPFINTKDTSFYISLFNRSKVLSRQGKTKEAIAALELSVKLFGEFSDSWALLAENYYRLNRVDKGNFAVLNSIITNYAFGLPSKKTIEYLQKMIFEGKYSSHPIIKRKDSLFSGGSNSAPFKVNYKLLLEVVEELKHLNDYRAALLLEQNYAYLMQRETDSIRKENNFKTEDWTVYFSDQISKKYAIRAMP